MTHRRRALEAFDTGPAGREHRAFEAYAARHLGRRHALHRTERAEND